MKLRRLKMPCSFKDHQNLISIFGVLTRGTSIFGVHDVGKQLLSKGQENDTGYLSIRHLSMYKNGKDLIGKRGWKGLDLLMKLGHKDKMTFVDLRPVRYKLETGEVYADKKITFEINNYDLLLIPPDDSKSRLNY